MSHHGKLRMMLEGHACFLPALLPTPARPARPLLMHTSAAGILAVEAYHSGIVDTLLYQQKDTETPYNVTVAELVELIADLENKVDSNSDAQGIVVMENGQEVANLVPVNSNAMAFARTPQEVLNIVYLGSALKSGGGFFPAGVNGYFGPQGAGSS